MADRAALVVLTCDAGHCRDGRDGAAEACRDAASSEAAASGRAPERAPPPPRRAWGSLGRSWISFSHARPWFRSTS
jgi:hypothetical protein